MKRTLAAATLALGTMASSQVFAQTLATQPPNQNFSLQQERQREIEQAEQRQARFENGPDYRSRGMVQRREQRVVTEQTD